MTNRCWHCGKPITGSFVALGSDYTMLHHEACLYRPNETVAVWTRELLARRYNALTQCWEAPGLTPIPAEVMDAIDRPVVTGLDVMAVLDARDKIAALEQFGERGKG